MDVSQVEQAEQVAVPIIAVDQYIDMTDLQDGGSLAGGDGAGGFAQRVVNADAFDLSPMATMLRDKTYDTYADRLPATILPEEQVIQTGRYKNFTLLDDESNDDRMQRFSRIKVPEGYKQYSLGQGAVFGDRQQKMFDAVPDKADALLFVSAEYAMVKDTPFYYSLIPLVDVNQAFIEATVRMEMVDEEGNNIMTIQQVARSDDHVNTVGGITMNPDKIQKLCVGATESAVAKVDKATKKELKG